MKSHCVIIFISLVISDIRNIFMCLLAFNIFKSIKYMNLTRNFASAIVWRKHMFSVLSNETVQL